MWNGKRAEIRKWEKLAPKKQKTALSPEMGKNGPNMTKNGNMTPNPFSGHFWAILFRQFRAEGLFQHIQSLFMKGSFPLETGWRYLPVGYRFQPLGPSLVTTHPSDAVARGPLFHSMALRGPAVILFTSRDTCSDSIAKLFRACFYGEGVSHNYCAIRCKTGYRTDVPV